jgi:uncharacterized membrane protein
MPGQDTCRLAAATVQQGPDRGTSAAFRADAAGDNELVDVRDEVLLHRNVVPRGADPAQTPPYAFAGFERRAPLLWLVLAFVCFVLVFGRWRALRPLVGLAVSLVIVAQFVVPAILSGRDAVAVATVGACAVALITIPLTHGLGARSLAAVLGTLLSSRSPWRSLSSSPS